MKTLIFICCGILVAGSACAQAVEGSRDKDLGGGWVCQRASDVSLDGAALSEPGQPLDNWMHAVVPGTVLTSLLAAGKVPDPFYGMNNKLIPDIYNTGVGYYTYWFVKDFRVVPGGQVWLDFRGVNYGYDVYCNGHRLTAETHYGMFLRASFNITSVLRADGKDRIAVIVYPPDPPGNPNGGQGGDGTIAKSVTHQYVAGWDWIQPVRDRNTGIWDRVSLRRTGDVRVGNPHVVTLVPGPSGSGAGRPAYVHVTLDLTNAAHTPVAGRAAYVLDGKTFSRRVTVPADSTITVTLPIDTMPHPRLWWPNGYGAQPLYPIDYRFGTSDRLRDTIGIRQIRMTWNPHTRSRELSVNGKKVFIKGGNWIVADEMLRLTPALYDAEVRYHHDMRLNLIRVWGGALTERPEFYSACDRYGILVMQDFWNSGDCNGRWRDPKKLEDQATRRKYPDDHALFLRSAADQIRMIRNHPSLAFWCGGNEITPPDDILVPLRDSIMPLLDGTRWFADYSNTDSMSFNSLGGNGDGPYGMQPPRTFWIHRTFPFNSEVGSVGVGDYASLQRFIPAADLIAPQPGHPPDSVWMYHKYLPYGHFMDAYGQVPDVRTFARDAQLLNYDEYRWLIEGFSAHAWDWYTGVIIWKTQNPWTALRGQMFDCYLDPNACLFGLRKAGAPLHAAFDPATDGCWVFNQGADSAAGLHLTADAYTMEGKRIPLLSTRVSIGENESDSVTALGAVDSLRKDKGLFLWLHLGNVDENLYWLPDSSGKYSGLETLAEARPNISMRITAPGRALVTIREAAGQPPAFFIRLALIDTKGRRVLPVFYSDNYVSLMPGTARTIEISWPGHAGSVRIEAEGWNVADVVRSPNSR